MSRRAARGAASVEMALCMIVFIPAFFYTLFLDDLLRHSLDAQEAALSTVWDFTVQDYNKDLKEGPTNVGGPLGGKSMVQKQARLMFCDHQSGKDRYNEMRDVTNEDGTSGQTYADCHDTDHHSGLVGHACWINDDAKQVTCEAPERMVGALGVPVHTEYQGAFTHGGLIRCAARAVVENYLIPETFLPEFSRHEGGRLSKKKWRDTPNGQGDKGIHANAQAGTDETAYFLAEQRLAILTDTWALNERRSSESPAAASPGSKSGELHSRVANVYRNRLNVGHPMVIAASGAFFAQAAGNNLLNPAFTRMALDDSDLAGGDNPLSPNVASAAHLESQREPTSTVTQSGQDASYFNTEWRDWERDNNRRAYEERGNWYLGCNKAGGC